MLTRITNEKGAISFDDQMVSDLLEIAVEGSDGKVWLTKGASPDIIMHDKGVFVRADVTVAFGASIKSVLSSVMKRLKKDINDQLGLDVENIEMVVTAVAAKKEAKRFIVYDLHGNYTNMDDEQ